MSDRTLLGEELTADDLLREDWDAMIRLLRVASDRAIVGARLIIDVRTLAYLTDAQIVQLERDAVMRLVDDALKNTRVRRG